MAFEYALALTGSIATGKSSVADCFLACGFKVIDADKVAHKILDEQAETIAKIFGKGLIEKGKVNRKALGKIVFAEEKKREALEALLHPLIYDAIEKKAKALDSIKEPYLVDIPLFFEGERYPIERSIVVYTPKEEQLKRLMRRDGYNKEEALRRIGTQIDIEQKRKKATYLIDNSANRERLEERCIAIKEEILKDFK
jgi:dephospho-CoA kinase